MTSQCKWPIRHFHLCLTYRTCTSPQKPKAFLTHSQLIVYQVLITQKNVSDSHYFLKCVSRPNFLSKHSFKKYGPLKVHVPLYGMKPSAVHPIRMRSVFSFTLNLKKYGSEEMNGSMDYSRFPPYEERNTRALTKRTKVI